MLDILKIHMSRDNDTEAIVKERHVVAFRTRQPDALVVAADFGGSSWFLSFGGSSWFLSMKKHRGLCKVLFLCVWLWTRDVAWVPS
jgi:hypothetical protein